MLRLIGHDKTHTCDGWSRREFLRVGALSLGGLSLPGLLRAETESGLKSFVHDKAVVMLNLQGGPSQFETFDPKMDIPSENRSAFGEVRTSLPGIRFAGQLPQLARMANQLAVVRSYRHGINDHARAAKHVAAGGNPTGACMGTLYSAVAGTTDPTCGMPLNTIVIPAAIDASYQSFNAVPSRVTDTGTLPATYKAFDPSDGGELLTDMTLTVPEGRFENRKELMRRLDTLRRKIDISQAVQSANTFHQQATETILGGINAAFQWQDEDPKLVERYDTSHLVVPKRVIAQRGTRGNLVKNHSPVSLGKQMLLARRLCEAGCRFITVTSAGWDMHGDHEFEIYDGMPLLGPALDKAVSAFLEDVSQRGLREKILLVITGEFGRTPRINDKGGRDHWGNLCPLVFAGGGLPMGQVIGASDRHGGEPITEPVTSAHLLGTLMSTLFDIGDLRTQSGIPREILDVITQAPTIRQLV